MTAGIPPAVLLLEIESEISKRPQVNIEQSTELQSDTSNINHYF